VAKVPQVAATADWAPLGMEEAPPDWETSVGPEVGYSATVAMVVVVMVVVVTAATEVASLVEEARVVLPGAR